MEKNENPLLDTTPSTQPEAADRRDWALIVVHGIGATVPGATVDAVLPALEALKAEKPALELSGERKVLMLSDHREKSTDAELELIELFPVHVRLASYSGQGSGVVAEVYWADLSKVSEGVVHLVWRVFVTIFGLYNIVDQAAAQPGRPAWLLRILLYVSGWLLRGPIAALNAYNLVLLLLHALPPALSVAGFVDWVAVPLGLVGIGLGTLLWKKLKEKSPAWATFFGSVAFVGAWMALTSLLRVALPRSWWIIDKLGGPIKLSPEQLTRGELLSEGEVWLVLSNLVPIGWLWILQLILLGLAAFVWVAACGSAERRYRHALTLAFFTAILQCVLWILIVPVLMFLAMRATGMQAVINSFDNYWKVLGVQYLGASVVLLAAGGTWAVRWLMAVPGRNETRPLPRLLVGFWIQASLISLFLVGSAYFLYDLNFDGLARFEGKDVVVVLASLFAFLATVIPASGLRSGIHIVADVINHFHRVPARFPRPWAGPDSESEFPIRNRIEARVKAVLAKVLKTYRPHRLLLLAHSQGTVAVTGVLRQEQSKEIERLLGEVQEIRLSTMGSPLTHLYQEYFPSQYPPFDAKHWDKLRERVHEWLHLYRDNDFVGTLVDGRKDWPVNKRVSTTGGHVNYWRQASVVRELNGFFWKPREER
jgi:hypothetical protein